MLSASLSEYLEDIMLLPIGELYLNSMDRDGTGQGYDYDLLDSLPTPMHIPIILAGGVVFLGYHIQLRLYKKYV